MSPEPTPVTHHAPYTGADEEQQRAWLEHLLSPESGSDSGNNPDAGASRTRDARSRLETIRYWLRVEEHNRQLRGAK